MRVPVSFILISTFLGRARGLRRRNKCSRASSSLLFSTKGLTRRGGNKDSFVRVCASANEVPCGTHPRRPRRSSRANGAKHVRLPLLLSPVSSSTETMPPSSGAHIDGARHAASPHTAPPSNPKDELFEARPGHTYHCMCLPRIRCRIDALIETRRRTLWMYRICIHHST